MPDPVVVLTDHGSIELTASAGDCIVEGCRKKGGNMVRFVVHHTDWERPQGFKVCGTHFAQAVGLMMQREEEIEQVLRADLEAAEAILRELQENSKAGGIEDPHFRHWTSATIGSYFGGKGDQRDRAESGGA